LSSLLKKKFWGNLNFNLMERFNSVGKGLEKLDADLYKDEIKWFNNRYSFLNNLNLPKDEEVKYSKEEAKKN